MRYTTFSYRDADKTIKRHPSLGFEYQEIIDVIKNISDASLIKEFYKVMNENPRSKSLSIPINNLIRNGLIKKSWKSEVGIRKSGEIEEQGFSIHIHESKWRIDFAKKNIALEVAFNHNEATAHNLIKPTLAGQFDHQNSTSIFDQDIKTKIGVIITVTNSLKKAGCFDGAIGTFESFLQYLDPYRKILDIPMMIIGLEPPEGFYIVRKKQPGGKLKSVIEKI